MLFSRENMVFEFPLRESALRVNCAASVGEAGFKKVQASRASEFNQNARIIRISFVTVNEIN